MLSPKELLGANDMMSNNLFNSPMGFEISPIAPIAPNPTTDIDKAMEWMKNNPDKAKELDQFLEQNPDVFNMLLDSLDK